MRNDLRVVEAIVGGVAAGEVDRRFFKFAPLLDVVFGYLVSGGMPEGIHDERSGGKCVCLAAPAESIQVDEMNCERVKK